MPHGHNTQKNDDRCEATDGRKRDEVSASESGTTDPSGFSPAGIALMLVRFYRKAISPWLPPACRFSPTCSEYALTAIKKYGAFRGGMLTAWRIMRCQPLCKGGYDPVPEIRRWTKSTRKINNEHQGKT